MFSIRRTLGSQTVTYNHGEEAPHLVTDELNKAG